MKTKSNSNGFGLILKNSEGEGGKSLKILIFTSSLVTIRNLVSGKLTSFPFQLALK